MAPTVADSEARLEARSTGALPEVCLQEKSTEDYLEEYCRRRYSWVFQYSVQHWAVAQ